MANSKNKKSVIALVVMALLLVASIVLAATGAWFTDKETGTSDKTLDFGKVDITLTNNLESATWSGLGTESKVMPGSKLAGTFVLENAGDQDVYYTYTLSADLYSGETKIVLTEDQKALIKITAEPETALTKEAGKEFYKLAAGSTTVTFNIKVEISENLTNKLGEYVMNGGDYTVKCAIEVDAVQAANFTANDFTGITFEKA